MCILAYCIEDDSNDAHRLRGADEVGGPRPPSGGREGHLQLTDEEPEALRAPAGPGRGQGAGGSSREGKLEAAPFPRLVLRGLPCLEGLPGAPCPRLKDLARLRAEVPPPSEAGRATGGPPTLAAVRVPDLPAPEGPGLRSVSSVPLFVMFSPSFFFSFRPERSLPFLLVLSSKRRGLRSFV